MRSRFAVAVRLAVLPVLALAGVAWSLAGAPGVDAVPSALATMADLRVETVRAYYAPAVVLSMGALVGSYLLGRFLGAAGGAIAFAAGATALDHLGIGAVLFVVAVAFVCLTEVVRVEGAGLPEFTLD